MNWMLVNASDPRACALADRHYSRKTIGAPQMMPPGRKIVLITEDEKAVWGTNWPFAEYVLHDWAGAMMCTIFRNEGPVLSSTLIRQALACTRWRWPDLPDLGMVTMINRDKTRPKAHPGYCFRRAGFTYVGETKGGLSVVQILPEGFPEAEPPLGLAEQLEMTL